MVKEMGMELETYVSDFIVDLLADFIVDLLSDFIVDLSPTS